MIGWAFRQLAFWLIGGFGLYLVVANRMLLSPAPGDPPKPEPAAPAVAAEPPNSLVLHARADGYVYAEAAVNGVPLRMAFDTGASLVALTPGDAARAGVAGGLDYSMTFSTANGRALGAPVKLREIRIGQLEIDDVDGVVMQNLSVSLLGQSFLHRLDSYQMHDGVLTLTWQ